MPLIFLRWLPPFNKLAYEHFAKLECSEMTFYNRKGFLQLVTPAYPVVPHPAIPHPAVPHPLFSVYIAR